MIGKDIFNLLLRIVVEVERAQYLQPQHKENVLIKISPILNGVKMLVRVTKKLGLINDAIYLKTETELLEIGKMLGGWIKSLDQDSPKSPPS